MERTLAIVLAFSAVLQPMVAVAAPGGFDAVIQRSVQQKFAQNHIARGGSVLVTVKGGVVTLDGRVATPAIRQRAFGLAKRTTGVKSVVNDLSVQPIPH
jgi:osmotically-inducible protein OsmY